MTVEEAEDYFTMLADAVKEDERENAIAKMPLLKSYLVLPS